MRSIKVSVIVPVYYVEKYLSKCLESLVNQTLKDIEIIVVNDGSPDNSQEIIEKYVDKYDNVFSYVKENGGLSDARNYGLKYASGEYISFIDSDDYVDIKMYEVMYKKAKSGNFDMVVCDLNYVYENDNQIIRVDSGIKSDTSNVKKIMLNFYPAIWNKLIKRNCFKENIEFKKGVWFEDVEFMYRLLPFIESIGVVKEPFNQYLQREGSITSTIDKRLYHCIDNWNGIIDFYKENNIYDEYKKELEYCYVRYLYATFVSRAAKYSFKDYEEAVNVAIKNVLEKFPKYRKNKYFYGTLKGIYLICFNRLIAKIYYKKVNQK